jgi:hypothetical protein
MSTIWWQSGGTHKCVLRHVYHLVAVWWAHARVLRRTSCGVYTHWGDTWQVAMHTSGDTWHMASSNAHIGGYMASSNAHIQQCIRYARRTTVLHCIPAGQESSTHSFLHLHFAFPKKNGVAVGSLVRRHSCIQAQQSTATNRIVSTHIHT